MPLFAKLAHSSFEQMYSQISSPSFSASEPNRLPVQEKFNIQMA